MARAGIGIDVSKAWLDVASTETAAAWRVPNASAGLEQLVAQLQGVHVHRIVLEASGGYERTALERLHEAGFAVVLVQPIRARHFARALGKYAKTDAIDAHVLARMALLAVDDVPLWAPVADAVADLKALVDRRQQLLAMRDAEKKRLRFARSIVRADLQATVLALSARIAALNHHIDTLLAASSALAEDVALLQSVRGVGRVSAATLRVFLPERGTLTRQQVAALVGIAPLNRDSGGKVGRRYIRGGRAVARHALYMAALAATRWNVVIQARYTHLVAKGKKPKVALVACMRKLLIHLNGLMRSHLARLEPSPAMAPR